MYKVLEFLDGKKAKLLAILGVILGMCSRLGYIDAQMATDILSILTIMAGGASVATDRVMGSFRYRSK